MAYDEGLAQRVRELLDELDVRDMAEKKMFGGIAFMLRGNLACGVLKKEGSRLHFRCRRNSPGDSRAEFRRQA